MVTSFVCLLHAQDIALTYVPLGPKAQPFGYGDMGARWSHRPGQPVRINVCWDDPLPQDPGASKALSENRKLVKEIVIKIWSTPVAVVFEGWDGCLSTRDDGVHIAVYDKRNDGPHAVALGKNLNKIYHGVVLNFDFQKWNPRDWCKENDENRKECVRAIAVHEFGHVLGLAHEQNRDDRPKNLDSCDDKTGAFITDKFPGTQKFGVWDAQSVMNYCHTIYKDGGYSLSANDIKSIQAMYPARI